MPARLLRVVVGVDPAVTNTETSDETGIIVAGVADDKCAYVLDDLSGACPSSSGHGGSSTPRTGGRPDRRGTPQPECRVMVERVLRVMSGNLSYRSVVATGRHRLGRTRRPAL